MAYLLIHLLVAYSISIEAKRLIELFKYSADDKTRRYPGG